MLIFWMQDVGPNHGHGGPDLGVIAMVIAGAIVGVLIYKLVDLAVLGIRRRIALRRHERAVASAERRARALMGELCPEGWRAQVTLFEPGDELPGAPGGGWARVALDWAELDPERTGQAVVRRVWAPTIAEALEAMVADRCTDEALEQIEHGAAAEGAEWPDL
jgi:hypothetical protein